MNILGMPETKQNNGLCGASSIIKINFSITEGSVEIMGGFEIEMRLEK